MDLESDYDPELVAAVAKQAAEKFEKEATPKRVLVIDGCLGASFHRALAEAIASRHVDVVALHEAQMEMRDPIIPEIEMIREFDKQSLLRERSYNRSVPYPQQQQSRHRRQHRGRR